jgi:osmoprotectant transport system substrate-binding protein
MKSWIARLATFVVVAVFAVAAAGCGGDDNNSSGGSSGGGASSAPSGQPGKGKSLTLGSKNFTEQFVLGQLYKQALEAKGYTVNYKKNLGSTEIADKALTSGQINAYPEYIGIFLTTTAGDTKTYDTTEQAYAAANKFAQGRVQSLSKPTPFEDVDAIGVKKEFADKNGLKSVADLKKLGSSLKLAGPPEFKTRFTGLVGLKKVYSVSPKFVPLAIGLQYKALDDGKVDAADVFTTDGQLQRGSYTVLEDPQKVFGIQNVSMLIDQKKADELGPEFTQTVDAVSAKLTVEAMQKMNAAVDLDKQAPEAVATQFLQANGLLGTN